MCFLVLPDKYVGGAQMLSQLPSSGRSLAVHVHIAALLGSPACLLVGIARHSGGERAVHWEGSVLTAGKVEFIGIPVKAQV